MEKGYSKNIFLEIFDFFFRQFKQIPIKCNYINRQQLSCLIKEKKMKEIKKEWFRMRITPELKSVMVQAATEQGKTLTDLMTDFLMQIAIKRNEKITFGT